MSSIVIRPEELSATIARQLDSLSKEVTEKANQAAEKAAAGAVEELKSTSPVRHTDVNSKKRPKPGLYAKGWKKTKEPTVLGLDTYTVHNTHYQLTHLLEFGHVLRQGGRAGEYPHIAQAEKNAGDKFLEELYKDIRNL